MQFLPIEVLLPCQIVGWLPLKHKAISGKREAEFSLLWFTWGLIVTVTNVLLSCWALYWDLTGKLCGKPIRMLSYTSTFTVFVGRVVVCLLAIVVFLSTALKYQQFIDMYNSLQHIDEDLQPIERNDKFKYKIFVFLTLKIIAISFTIYFFADLSRSYVIYIPYWLIYTVQATLIIFYINLCSVIKERFYLINENLRKEVINHSFGQFLWTDDGCCGSFDYVPGGKVLLSKIKRLTELYWLLCEFTCKANHCLGWHLLSSIISLSILTIISLFNLATAIWPPAHHQLDPQMLIRFVWVIINSAELLMVLRASSSITDMAIGTATMVSKLLNRKMGGSLKKHLEVFLLSLHHQNAKFSALGLFEVQSHIIIPIAGAVTTYLVMLIQFQAQTTKE